MDESPRSNTFFTIAVGYLIFNSTFFTIAVGYLIFNTVSAIVRIRQDMVAVTFTISFFVFLMILFWSVSVFQKLPQDSKQRERLKIPIWILATALNLLFAYRVWTIVPPGMILGWLVWGMAGTASLVTFYFSFLYGDKKTGSGK
eukprot:TRINITY_DN20833_c0_g1_i1.p1 TRINITY_DN20833_c0_g1~~TRINITY_DN20833_c0_g1_i1.p1  ORF type:complete len:164 (-),score=11.38 TRINITY_DN20833_c0_g1_i1:138-569(-)